MNESIKPKRWYDRQPKLAQAVRLMFLFPVEIKSLICEGLVLIANREFDVNETNNSFRTVGVEKVLGMHKSKNRRREYDQNEVLHKAMNYLYILSEENQDLMADHILELVNYIHEYLSACQAFKKEPTIEDVARITQTYVEKGSQEVARFLEELRRHFHRQLMKQEEDSSVDFLSAVSDERILGIKLKKTP